MIFMLVYVRMGNCPLKSKNFPILLNNTFPIGRFKQLVGNK